MIEVRHYLTPNGKDVFDEWFSHLADRRTQAKIATRINRLAAGNFGDSKTLREGVSELRIDWGPGYRVYFAWLGKLSVLILCAGDKRSRPSDIQRTVELLKDYRERTKTT